MGDNVLMASIGSYIKALREIRHYSERKLGIMSKVSHATICRIENDISRPNPATLRKLAGPLGVSYEVLLIVAGYLNGNRFIPSNIKLIREKNNMSYTQFADNIRKVTGKGISPDILEQLEAGKSENIIPERIDCLDAIAKYEGVNVGFFFYNNTSEDLNSAIKENPYSTTGDQESLLLKHIKDENLKQWVNNPSNIDYLVFVKKMSDLGIDPDFVFEEFISKIFKKKKKKEYKKS